MFSNVYALQTLGLITTNRALVLTVGAFMELRTDEVLKAPRRC